MKNFKLLSSAVATLFLLFAVGSIQICYADPNIIVAYGESQLEPGPEQKKPQPPGLLIPYDLTKNKREIATEEALHFLSAMVFGYTFEYKPGSKVMKTEEVFELQLRDSVHMNKVRIIGEGAWRGIYRVRIAYSIDPYTEKWLRAFTSNKLRLEEAEGTSDFFSGWWGRSVAYQDALKNLVLISAKKRYSSRPLSIKGDIILKENPEFNVGAGRWYCRIKGYVNFVEVVTY